MERIFALDIGTRLVMGLIMEKSKEGYRIIASARTEHRQRAMYDGQVHDIEEVARAVRTVKEDLEQKMEGPLRYVSVAAAGRALKTAVASAQRSEIVPVVWDKESILALEMEAVQQALREIQATDEEVSYHCVGYSIVESLLEGQHLTHLIGQRGKRVQVKVIATFLPRTVIDGLTGVISRVGLEMRDLTLEPIAAGQAAIPPDMRRMNLALVDVGAGTADIALTREGSFFAYGMVPMAGDEVTERICQNYLLDFQMGEILKRSLESNEELSFIDFLGIKTTVSRDEVNELIKPVVEELADKISREIIRLNQRAPHAVILIGGGGLTPMLPALISDGLGLPKNRVGIQIRERLNDVEGEEAVNGPEAITPIGIGISSLEGQGLHYFTVTVNETQVPIFELQLSTVSDALLAAGISPRLLFSRPGPALTFEINGEIQVIKGSFGQPAQFILNDKPTYLDQKLQPGDKIQFQPARDGEVAQVTLEEFLPQDQVKGITVNGKAVRFSPKIYCNGIEAQRDAKIIDGCKIDYRSNQTIEDLLRFLDLSRDRNPKIRIRVNGKDESFDLYRRILVNGENIPDGHLLKDLDEVVIQEQELRICDLRLQPSPLRFYVNGSELNYPPQIFKITSRGHEVSEQEILRDGMDLRVEGYGRMPMISDLLPYVEISKEAPPGSKLEILVNNKPSEFTTVLHPGDRISIQWVSII